LDICNTIKEKLTAIAIPLADAIKLFLNEEKNTTNINPQHYRTSFFTPHWMMDGSMPNLT